MKTLKLGLLALLVIPLISLAQVYRWVDENGQVHFGDNPPEGVKAEPVTIRKGPSEERVQEAQQNLQDALDARETAQGQADELPLLEAAPESGIRDDLTEADLACYAPINNILSGATRQAYDPIEPTSINDAQRQAVGAILGRGNGRWSGTLTEIACSGKIDRPQSESQIYDIRITGIWNRNLSQLRLEARGTNRRTRVQEQQDQWYEIGNALYFINSLGTGTTTSSRSISNEGNKAEGLYLDDESFAFMIKRRSFTIIRTELHHLRITRRALEMTVIFSYNNIVTGKQIWKLKR